jgi:hypothetical protein
MVEPSKIVLGLDAQASRAAIDAAALLAARLGRDLHALFVEDEELLRLARLPSSAWIAHTGTLHALDLEIMERALRGAAARLRSDVARAAGPSKLHWTFRVRRGRLFAELSGIGSEQDLFVIPPRTASGDAQTLGTVVALLAEHRGAARMLELLDALASLGPALLLVPEAAGSDTLDLARGWAERRGPHTRVSRSTGAEPEQVLGVLRGERPALLVVPRGESVDRPKLRELREQAPCPLLVVR